MKMERKLMHRLGLQLATAGASALLLVSPVSAQSDSASQQSGDINPATAVEVRQLDENDNQKLEWNELQPRLESVQLDWDQERVMGEFDQNDDDALDATEYELFLTQVDNQKPQGNQSAQQERDTSSQVVADSQQAEVKIDPQAPKVKVDPAEPNVNVDQQAAQVSVDQAKPEVTVQEQKPKVIVTQPEPEVTVNIPEPEVKVVQPDPKVNVDQSQPTVQVDQPKPEVSVSQNQPDVEVQQREPEVAVQPAQPEVVLQDSKDQPEQVTMEQDQQQAQVQVEQAEPEVEVSQAEPQVNVQDSGGADVQIQESQGTEQQQAQRDPQTEQNEDMTVEDVEEMEAPAAGISSQAAQQSQQPGALDSMPLTELEGRSVVTTEGDQLGEIEQIVMPAQGGGAAAVVISVGGLLGIGDQDVLVPVDELTVQNDQLTWQTTKTKDEIKESNQFNQAEYTQVSTQTYETVGELKQAQ